ncbi:MAG: nucleotidyltransferase domain-containing protein, partial [Candidatus Bathyarchaeia archaeon]
MLGLRFHRKAYLRSRLGEPLRLLRRSLRLLERLSKELPKSVLDAIKIFLENLVREVGEAEVYLFGSYARGDWIEESDIDLIVISP